MIIAMLFASLVTLLHEGTRVQPDCKARNFEPEACEVSKLLDEAGK